MIWESIILRDDESLLQWISPKNKAWLFWIPKSKGAPKPSKTRFLSEVSWLLPFPGIAPFVSNSLSQQSPPTTGLTLPPPRGSQPQALFGIQPGSASNWKPFQFPQTSYSVLPLCLVALFSPVTAASVCRELVRTGPLCDSMLPSIGHPQMSAQYTDWRSSAWDSPTGLCAAGFKSPEGEYFSARTTFKLDKTCTQFILIIQHKTKATKVS